MNLLILGATMALQAGCEGGSAVEPELPDTDDVAWSLLEGRLAHVTSPYALALILLYASTREIRLIGSGQSFLHPALSPDLTEIAYSTFGGGDGGGIWSIATTGEPVDCKSASPCGRRLVDNETGEYGPAWSKDSRLAYQVDVEELNGLAVDGRLIQNGCLALGLTRPAWVPDGTLLARLSCGPVYGLYRVDPSSGETTVIIRSTQDHFPARPAVPPDGSRLAYVNHGNAVPEIWLSNIDGSEARRIVSSGDNPVWSPDGQWIAFDRYEDGSLLLIDPDGQDEPIFVAEGMQPSWRAGPGA